MSSPESQPTGESWPVPRREAAARAAELGVQDQ